MQGEIVYREYTERMAVYLENNHDYYELHCGDMFYVFYKNKWVITRIEYHENEWYLVGLSELKGFKMLGLKVRYKSF